MILLLFCPFLSNISYLFIAAIILLPANRVMICRNRGVIYRNRDVIYRNRDVIYRISQTFFAHLT